ncbi:hypothetical protein [Clostridium neonatale]|uniref:hypothetical protein n=1 Tax=Clostridium neonatale TaxID=137838 RepID=UPI00291C26C3|nr:conserved hypothetical protein [Clostridium neonatale]
MNNFMSLDKRLELWVSKLSHDEVILLTHAIQTEAASLIDKKMEAINATIETSITAALITEFDFSLEDTEKVFEKSNEYIEEAEPIIKFYKEDYKMVVKKVENKIKERVKVLILGGKSQIQTIALLKKDFPKVPNEDLIIIYKQAEEEYKKHSKQNEKDKEKSESKNKAQIEEIKVSHANIPKNEMKSSEKVSEQQEEEIKPKFEVENITLKGQYGTYIKAKDGVQAGQEYFKDSPSVDRYVQAELDKMDKDVETEVTKLQDKIDELYRNAHSEKEVFKRQTDEIKAVFAY